METAAKRLKNIFTELLADLYTAKISKNYPELEEKQKLHMKMLGCA